LQRTHLARSPKKSPIRRGDLIITVFLNWQSKIASYLLIESHWAMEDSVEQLKEGTSAITAPSSFSTGSPKTRRHPRLCSRPAATQSALPSRSARTQNTSFPNQKLDHYCTRIEFWRDTAQNHETGDQHGVCLLQHSKEGCGKTEGGTIITCRTRTECLGNSSEVRNDSAAKNRSRCDILFSAQPRLIPARGLWFP